MNNTNTMTAAELKTMVAEICGWAPVDVRIIAGTVTVYIPSDTAKFASLQEGWKACWTVAKAVRAALPEASFMVTKPQRHVTHGGTFKFTNDAFTVVAR